LEKILDYCENALNELIKTDIDTVSQKFSTKKGIL
jgi:aminoacyl-tRNA hydrolase